MDEQMMRKSNLKLYSIYKMFSWDLLFYYAISFLFLTQTKNLSVSSILLADAFYPLFKIIFQVPCITIADHIGKRNALLAGNLFLSASILILILGNGLSTLFISNLIMAIGFVFKDFCEPTILNDSIPESKNKADIFTKIDGKGTAYHYYLDAIASLSTGFLFVVNGYLPMFCCFFCCLIASLISYNFNEIKLPPKSLADNTNLSGFKAFNAYIKDLKISFRFIFNSNRLKALLIYSALFYSILALYPTFRSSLLTDLQVPEQYFGIIVAITQFISAIFAKRHIWMHRTFRNRVLTWFAFPLAISLIFAGLSVACNVHPYMIAFFVGIMFLIISIIKGPYNTLIKRYFNSFSNPDISTKIYAAKSLIESLIRIVIFLIASFLFGITSTSYVLIILGCLLTIIFVLLLDYMKTRVGLKPEQYDKKDIEFRVLK